MSQEHKDKVLAEAYSKLTELNASFLREIATELKGPNYYLYLRAFSLGLQEYVEAVTFCHYIKVGRLITLEEVNRPLIFDEQAQEAQSDIVAASEPILEKPPATIALAHTP
ncbi:hypothetical protein HPB48_027052 [Haemaphysalis longicornis]|uniref:Uncharacterized protein n=1 Tax=Haemaphysalis longicornis TaxID=44386 RepID=A0A9J6HDU6_HAELO|nr:hypothetical protein HPB48_027051 [Haemaphysalis longicornis]KAH9385014.1 hypothetical protein HPB48_027052 [Haemaphysalis longicornis]